MGVDAMMTVNPKRTCDVCGAQRESRPGVFRLVAGRMVCSWHDNYVPLDVAERAPVKTFKIRPVANARPFAPVDTYETSEAQVLSYLGGKYRIDEDWVFAGALRTDVNLAAYSSGARGAGWAAVYLYELITENKRPLSTIRAARTLLGEIADWLLTRIVAWPGRMGVLTTASHSYGGFQQSGGTTGNSNDFWTANTAAAGLGLLRAYQVLGRADYLSAARAVLWHLRGCQSGGRLALFPSSNDSAGAQVRHFGAWATRTQHNVAADQVFHDHLFSPDALVAAEFYKAFLDAVGDEVIGSPGTGVNAYTSSREALLSLALAEALAFWLDGTYDATAAAIVNGLSTVTPRNAFNAFPAAKAFGTGTGSWQYLDAAAATGTTISGEAWALGIRGLRAAGQTARAIELFDWLMTFGANPVNQLPAVAAARDTGQTLGQTALQASLKGTYDPRFALAGTLKVRDGSPLAAVKYEAAGASYSLVTAGWLAALYSERQAARFRDLKDALGVPRRLTMGGADDARTFWLGQMGRCGLSLQPRTATSGTLGALSPYGAAAVGLVYRHAPQVFAERGH